MLFDENSNGTFYISDPRLKQLTDSKVNEWRRWFDTRLDDAIEAASTQQHPEIERKLKSYSAISFDRVMLKFFCVSNVRK